MTASTPRSLRVLVVDDNEDAAITLAVVLETTGHVTRTVHDGIKALEAAGDWQPDLVLLDIGLPGLNGLEVAAGIRKHPWGRTVLIWALSGWGQASDLLKSSQAGFDRHLVKPVDPGTLLRLLAEVGAERPVS